MARVGKEGPDHRAWRAAVLLGLALIAAGSVVVAPWSSRNLNRAGRVVATPRPTSRVVHAPVEVGRLATGGCPAA
jgi:hypothetical protein